MDNGSIGVGVRILAGFTTGGLAVLLAQPTDVVKVRLQVGKNGQNQVRYKSTLQAYRQIALNEGTRGLWKGNVLHHISRTHSIIRYPTVNTPMIYHIPPDARRNFRELHRARLLPLRSLFSLYLSYLSLVLIYLFARCGVPIVSYRLYSRIDLQTIKAEQTFGLTNGRLISSHARVRAVS